MILEIDRFERKHGNLQRRYDEWRARIEEEKGCVGGWRSVDCVYEEARKSFSDYCNLKETIPLEVMLLYEGQYENPERN